MKDFTQFGEQAAILEAAGLNRGGRLLDVGAYDGETFSMTRALMLQGWRGVFVEPSPTAFIALQGLYEHDERAVLLNAAIGLEWSVSPFWRTEDLLSTLDSAHKLKWEAGGYPFHAPYHVPTVPFDAVLDQFGPFDLISIDTEGTSHQLFERALNHKPRIIVIEHDGASARMQRMADGYRTVLANSLNLVLARK